MCLSVRKHVVSNITSRTHPIFLSFVPILLELTRSETVDWMLVNCLPQLAILCLDNVFFQWNLTWYKNIVKWHSWGQTFWLAGQSNWYSVEHKVCYASCKHFSQLSRRVAGYSVREVAWLKKINPYRFKTKSVTLYNKVSNWFSSKISRVWRENCNNHFSSLS